MRHKLGATFGVRIPDEDLDPFYAGVAVPAIVSPPEDVVWGMDANDRYGDCTIAGVDHVSAAWNASLGLDLPRMSVPQLVATYMRLTGGADSGLSEQHVAHLWMVTSIFGYTIRSAVRVPNNHVRQVIAQNKVAYLGVVLPESAEQQTEQGKPWSVVPSSIAGGHCVVGVGYDPEFLTIVTWGSLQKVTWDWWEKYAMETWDLEAPVASPKKMP